MFEARFIAPLQWWLPGVAPFGAARRGRDESRFYNVALCYVAGAVFVRVFREVFGRVFKGVKICLRYFEICQTYFELCPT